MSGAILPFSFTENDICLPFSMAQTATANADMLSRQNWTPPNALPTQCLLLRPISVGVNWLPEMNLCLGKIKAKGSLACLCSYDFQ